ncbi:acyl-CoA/acyl-ACP dehydrogenase [Erythrobacter sp. SDW2]|uniref:acyl-CoA dehydrogenase family protein n=1 Tax=Erythrobacter sp. SDW2 TaxID=2907154 RepID=UPI001F33DA1C|nr:acyl-CoA dehydrogenase family protein [Erythrobacter sp. SDW2]UIP06681.1 acyl-CoA/acyl-ACP dehydrogenase [Erythrobacter sp. SDW2]
MAILNEEQTMLRDMAQEWATNESPVGNWRKTRDAGQKVDSSAWSSMGQMGWTGIVVPEEFGGTDFGWTSLGLVVEELGKTLTASPLVATSLASAAIVLGGSQAQKEKYLPRLASGELVGTLAFDEGSRHTGSAAKATVSGGKLSGTKAFVHEADTAGLFVVSAADGVYLVEKGEGVSLSSRELTDRRDHAEVTFDGAAADKLADGGDDLADKILDRARILTSAEMLGMAQAVFDTTLDYLKQRVQFNQVLASFQALQHRMADLYADLELMRSAVEAGFQALDMSFKVPEAACLAKSRANEVLHVMSRQGIQLHGGIGMTDEYDVGFYLKRARVLEASWGNTGFLKDRHAKLAGY